MLILLDQIALVTVAVLGLWRFSRRWPLLFLGALGVVVGQALLVVCYAVAGVDLYGLSHEHWGPYLLFGIPIALLVVVFALLARPHVTAVRPHRSLLRTAATGLVASVAGALAGALCGGAIFLAPWAPTVMPPISGEQVLYFLLGGDIGVADVDIRPFWPLIMTPIVALAVAGGAIGAALGGFRLTAGRSARHVTDPAHLRSGNSTDHVAAARLRRVRLSPWVVSVAAVLTAVATVVLLVQVPLVQAAGVWLHSSDFVEDHYVAPTDDILHFPDKPKNLIHIYMESVENSFYDRANGGYFDQNFMPDLAQLTDENTTFSHNDGYGGPLETVGSDHSLAGMLNFQAGVPMLPHFYDHSNFGRMSYPDFRTLGDILHDHGYVNELMLGSNSGWHNMGDYYRRHGKFEVFDYFTAQERQLIAPEYLVWWGFEDDKLYEFAKDEMTRLAHRGKPFYFLLENADTHAPGGYVSANMTDHPSNQQMLNVVHYSQRQTVALVRWIQQQDWYRDTVIIVTGDHKSHDTKFFNQVDPAYQRTIVNTFINASLPNPGWERTHNRQFAPFDFFPTIVASLGITIDGDRLGLGVNLYSGRKTLLEEYGADKIQDALYRRNPFYENHRPQRLE